MKIEPSMMLITSEWNQKNSFRLIPMTKDSPFSEGIYDPSTSVLALMSCHSKESLHMVPRLDDHGDPLRPKKVRPGKQTHQEQRVSIDTFLEYYVSKKEEIINIVERLAMNSDTFDYKQFLQEDAKEEAPKKE